MVRSPLTDDFLISGSKKHIDKVQKEKGSHCMRK